MFHLNLCTYCEDCVKPYPINLESFDQDQSFIA